MPVVPVKVPFITRRGQVAVGLKALLGLRDLRGLRVLPAPPELPVPRVLPDQLAQRARQVPPVRRGRKGRLDLPDLAEFVASRSSWRRQAMRFRRGPFRPVSTGCLSKSGAAEVGALRGSPV